MDQGSNPEGGPTAGADTTDVGQAPGTGSGAAVGGDPDLRPVGVTAAVERGPAELSDEGEPVRNNPHASLEDREQARSTDDL